MGLQSVWSPFVEFIACVYYIWDDYNLCFVEGSPWWLDHLCLLFQSCTGQGLHNSWWSVHPFAFFWCDLPHSPVTILNWFSSSELKCFVFQKEDASRNTFEWFTELVQPSLQFPALHIITDGGTVSGCQGFFWRTACGVQNDFNQTDRVNDRV